MKINIWKCLSVPLFKMPNHNLFKKTFYLKSVIFWLVEKPSEDYASVHIVSMFQLQQFLQYLAVYY